MSSSRRWLGRFGLFLASTLISLLLLELGLRLRTPQGAEWLLSNSPSLYDTSIFEPDGHGQWQLRPGAVGVMHTPEFRTEVRVSKVGTRGADPGPKALGTWRLLTVGDSITLGAQVAEEQTFQHLLAEHLTQATGRRIEVFNAGVDGHGTWAANRQVVRLVPELQADAVLLTFFTGNDLQDNVRNRGRRPSPDLGLRPEERISPMARWSFLYTYWKVFQSTRGLGGDPRAADRYRSELSAFTREGADTKTRHASRDALRELSQTCQELGVPLFIAVAPPAFVVHTERAAATMALARLSEADIDLAAPAREILKMSPSSARVLDLSPALADAAGAQKLYFTFDGHWTPAGHAVVAQALGDLLKDEAGSTSR